MPPALGGAAGGAGLRLARHARSRSCSSPAPGCRCRRTSAPRCRGASPGAWNRLGVDAAIGVRAWDPQARIILRIGPLDLRAASQRCCRTAPGCSGWCRWSAPISATRPAFAINPVLAASEVPPLRLDPDGRSGAAARLEYLDARRRPAASGIAPRDADGGGVRGRDHRGRRTRGAEPADETAA